MASVASGLTCSLLLSTLFRFRAICAVRVAGALLGSLGWCLWGLGCGGFRCALFAGGFFCLAGADFCCSCGACVGWVCGCDFRRAVSVVVFVWVCCLWSVARSGIGVCCLVGLVSFSDGGVCCFFCSSGGVGGGVVLCSLFVLGCLWLAGSFGDSFRASAGRFGSLLSSVGVLASLG